nr:dolichyl-diphosphooligosaccharide--protein glycosyltransferase 48 kDa subunit [Ipomoea batatas]
MRNNSTQIVAIKVEVLKLSQVPNLMRNNSTNEVYTKVEVLKLRQVPNLWRDVETSEAGKRSKIEVVKSTIEISIRKIDLRDGSTTIADNARPITKLYPLHSVEVQILYDGFILFSLLAERFGGALDLAVVMDFVDSGHDLIVVADANASYLIRNIAVE